ncbi:hypothetical protein JMUB3935_2637 [Leptotrichia trevisanii]|uniref:Uncharacterized protein n=1 Tax=Leptotrichia trevisanii TaxID=109328 RepID=A0A510KPL0_9FUSO|nr:hypothetical protein JMUB3935_2637 [Leptotrichia trevisanii]
MKNLIRILALVLLGLNVTGCELFSLKFWRKVDKYRKKIGEKCCESLEQCIVWINMEIERIK